MVRELLDDAPALDRSLLELRATWPDLSGAHARTAARLRVFVLNWDPLGWLGDPFAPRATTTGDGDRFELVLYVTLADTGELADLCRSVVEVGADQEALLVAGAYAGHAHAGKVPGLLSARGTLTALDAPELEPAASGWEPIGLGAIEDLVQERFGPVDLDRSSVVLDPAARPAPGCPACAGRRFGFPAQLADEQPAMCTEHSAHAEAVVAERFGRAEASNPDGWRAIADASAALSEPTHGLPLELLRRLDEALNRGERSADLLSVDAVAALELADRLAGRPAQLADWVEHWMAHDWLLELPHDLARHGLVDEAVRVGDAFAELDRDHRALYLSDVAVILAEAGRADAALARVEANQVAFPRDVWTSVHAGDVHQALGDPDQAERAFRRASTMAEAQHNPDDARVAAERLADLLTGLPGREDDAAQAARAVERSAAAYGGPRVAVKIGRNEPCPCGSGRKYKKCCAA